jgi:membrane protease YdiL (CAAX protease family)
MAAGQIALTVALASGGYTADDYTDEKTPLAYSMVATAALWVGFIGVPWVITRMRGRGLIAELGLRVRPADASGLALGVVCQALLVPAISVPWVWFLGKNLDDLNDEASALVDRAGDPASRVLLVLVVAIGAPIAEEIFFRGFLQRGLMAWMPAPAAIAGSSLLFALTHFQRLQFPALAAFGAVLGLLAYRTGRLGPSIATHMGFNAITVIVLLLESR